MSDIEATDGIFDINNSRENSKKTCQCEQRINPRSYQVIVEFYLQLQKEISHFQKYQAINERGRQFRL